MTVDEKKAMVAAHPGCAFLRVIHAESGYEAILAIPRRQATEEREAAVQLWHGATVSIPSRRSA